MSETTQAAGAPASHTPKLSVLVPTYNYARYLPEAIDSVLNQQFTDYELLIADDGSTDDSREVIQRLAQKDPRIRFHFHPANLGMVQNWNYCLIQARGEYVQFLFGDDKLASRNALGRMVGLLDENPGAVLAAAARNIIDADSRKLGVAAHLGRKGRQSGLEVICRCLAANTNLVGEPSVVMFRRSAATRGFDARFRQIPDLEMWFHLLEHGDAIYTSEPLYSFRRHPLQQTAENRRLDLGHHEHVLLLADYYTHPRVRQCLSHRAQFIQIYWLRKRKEDSAIATRLESDLMGALGKGRYRWFYLQHKLASPFARLWRFISKRVFKKSLK